jgi:transposase
VDPTRSHLLAADADRLRKTLVDEQAAWGQRIQATLFDLGLPALPDSARGDCARGRLAELELPQAARERIEVCVQMIDAIEHQLAPIDRELRRFSREQAGCRALTEHFGIGPLTAPVILAELGDVSRLRRSRQAVRMASLDVGVERSDRRTRIGKLTKQGSPDLRWALYEAAQSTCQPTSPDRGDYLQLRERRLSPTQASLTIARKLARRRYHTLRELGPAALEEPA